MAAIRGLTNFRDHFAGFEAEYVLIGGVASHLALDQAGLEFRATKDLDIVLCAEALSAEFVRRFWVFVGAGKYEVQERSDGKKQFYRFKKPENAEYPFMLELFCRKPDEIELDAEGHLTPVPMDEEISSLSAILLDDDYYACIKRGRTVIDGVSILGPEYVLLFKARAWLDLSKRKASGEKVDSKHIKKHRNDVFRLFPLLSENQRVESAASIRDDMKEFVGAMRAEQGLDIARLGNVRNLNEVLAEMRSIYQTG